MKTAIAGLIVSVSLAGCIAVPVVEPAPVAGYYYAPPPATVYFGYRHGGGHHRHYRPYHHHRYRR